MHPMLILLAAASPVLYEAQVATYGCNSTANVTELQGVRGNAEAFQKRLFELFFYGECIAISPGAVVDGTVEGEEPNKVLRVLRDRSPPGYMVPIADFKLRGEATPKAGDAPKTESSTETKPEGNAETRTAAPDRSATSP